MDWGSLHPFTSDLRTLLSFLFTSELVPFLQILQRTLEDGKVIRSFYREEEEVERQEEPRPTVDVKDREESPNYNRFFYFFFTVSSFFFFFDLSHISKKQRNLSLREVPALNVFLTLTGPVVGREGFGASRR